MKQEDRPTARVASATPLALRARRTRRTTTSGMKKLFAIACLTAAACSRAAAPDPSSTSVAPHDPPAPEAPPDTGGPAEEPEEFDLGVVTVPNPKFVPKPGSSDVPLEARGRPSFRTGARGMGARLDTAGAALEGSGLVVRMYPVLASAGQVTITLSNTGSGYQEEFMLQVPNLPPTTPAPLLVAFHQYGVSQNAILNRTSFFQEALARNWYCIAPLGASQVSFNSLESQVNVRAAIDYVTSQFAIDRTRVYGVGFSMGGGCALGYAARHVDPAGVMFAALANHTGAVALPHVYAHEPDDNDADDNLPTPGSNLEGPDVLDFWYGGPPQANKFAYLRCSQMDLDPLLGAVLPGTDMSRNLAHVPVLNWAAAGEPLQYLYEQTDELHKLIRTRNTFNTLVIVPGQNHTWNTLDETAVCDWLQQFQLQLPSSGSTLADADGVWFRFQVEQDQAGDFTPFTWKVFGANNRFELSATRNLERLRVDCDQAGLLTTRPLTVVLASADGTGDELVLEDYAVAPSNVLRDGAPASFNYDTTSRRLTLFETDGATHTWTIAP